jgi:hypothetical protein
VERPSGLLGKYNGCSPSGVLTPPRCNSKSYSERWPFNVVGVSFQHKFGWRGGTELGKRIGTPSHSGPATRGSSRGRAKPQVMACRFHDEAEGAPTGPGGAAGGSNSVRFASPDFTRRWLQLPAVQTCNMSVVLTFYKCSLTFQSPGSDRQPLTYLQTSPCSERKFGEILLFRVLKPRRTIRVDTSAGFCIRTGSLMSELADIIIVCAIAFAVVLPVLVVGRKAGK